MIDYKGYYKYKMLCRYYKQVGIKLLWTKCIRPLNTFFVCIILYAHIISLLRQQLSLLNQIMGQELLTIVVCTQQLAQWLQLSLFCLYLLSFAFCVLSQSIVGNPEK